MKSIHTIKKQVKLYFISSDIIFIKSLTKKITSERIISIVHHTNGEGFFRQIVHDSPQPKDIVIVVIDNNLNNIEHPNEKDGLTILSEIRQDNRNYFCMFISDTSERRIKETALASGANSFFVKNDNTAIRLLNSIEQIENSFLLSHERKKTITSILIFFLFLIASSLLFLFVK